MFRGTTPKVTVHLPKNISVCDISELILTFSQKKRKRLIKRLNDFFVGKDCLFVRLTQKETLMFEAGEVLESQVRLLLKDGEAIASKKYVFGVNDILTNGEIKKGGGFF